MATPWEVGHGLLNQSTVTGLDGLRKPETFLSTKHRRDGRPLVAVSCPAPWKRESLPASAEDSMFAVAHWRPYHNPVLDLCILKKVVDPYDVDYFADKIDYCIDLMAKKHPLKRWEFAVDLRPLECASFTLVHCLRYRLALARNLVGDTYTYGVHPESELGVELSSGNTYDWIIRSSETAGLEDAMDVSRAPLEYKR